MYIYIYIYIYICIYIYMCIHVTYLHIVMLAKPILQSRRAERAGGSSTQV